MSKSKYPRHDSSEWGSDLFADKATAEQHAASTANVVHDERADDDHRLATAPSATAEPAHAGFGSRLSAAREARGLDIATCAQTLHLSARVLHMLESDDYSGMDSPVYVRSYLGKYATWLGVPQADITAHLQQLPEQAQVLVSTGGITHSRYLLERYATAATYMVLTAVIVVPIVWIGLKGGLDRDVAHLAPLDASPVQTTPALALPAVGNTKAPSVSTPPHTSNEPLQASMAPFIALEDVAPARKTSLPPVVDNSGSHSITLTLPAPSWVEITNPDGQRLEYGLLPAGTHKTYRSSDPLSLNIGNTDGAQVRVDGKAIDLKPYQRGNVARFRVKLVDGKAVPASL